MPLRARTVQLMKAIQNEAVDWGTFSLVKVLISKRSKPSPHLVSAKATTKYRSAIPPKLKPSFRETADTHYIQKPKFFRLKNGANISIPPALYRTRLENAITFGLRRSSAPKPKLRNWWSQKRGSPTPQTSTTSTSHPLRKGKKKVWN